PAQKVRSPALFNRISLVEGAAAADWMCPLSCSNRPEGSELCAGCPNVMVVNPFASVSVVTNPEFIGGALASGVQGSDIFITKFPFYISDDFLDILLFVFGANHQRVVGLDHDEVVEAFQDNELIFRHMNHTIRR